MNIIGITGTLGAGKGTIVDYLIQHYGYRHYSVRGYLIEEAERRGLPLNRDTFVVVANDLRATHSPSFIYTFYKLSLRTVTGQRRSLRWLVFLCSNHIPDKYGAKGSGHRNAPFTRMVS